MKKYEFTDDKIEFDGRVLTRIRALVDIPRFNVEVGDLGGYIEKESNLSHIGNCWVSDNARVFGNACVYGDAYVSGYARVSGYAQVSGNARVFGAAHISNNAYASGNAFIYGNAQVFGDAQVSDNARVSGNTVLYDSVRLNSHAKIESNDDFIVLGPAESSGRYTTAYKTQDSKIQVRCGCFKGTPDEFLAKINETHSNNKKFRNQYLDFHKRILEKFKNL